MITKTLTITSCRLIMSYKQIDLAWDIDVFEDGRQISHNQNAAAAGPGTDLSAFKEAVNGDHLIALANLFWTPDVLAAWEAKLTADAGPPPDPDVVPEPAPEPEGN